MDGIAKVSHVSSSLQVNILPYSFPPKLSENIYFHGVSIKILRATSP